VRVQFLEGNTRLIFGETMIGSVEPLEAIVVSSDWTVRTGSTSYSLGARVDVLGNPDEAVLTNNAAFDTLLVQATGAPEVPHNPAPVRKEVSLALSVYPNPFSPRTTVRFFLPDRSHVRLAVYDLAGRLVDVLVDGRRDPGVHRVEWDGTNESRAAVASGVYFARLETVLGVRTSRFVVIR
jgi:hypothetical protein